MEIDKDSGKRDFSEVSDVPKSENWDDPKEVSESDDFKKARSESDETASENVEPPKTLKLSERRGVPKTKTRLMRDLTTTRPFFIESKQGTTGKEVLVEANYFKLTKVPEWAIHNYHVEYEPAIETKPQRKTLLYEHRDILGGYLFDGTSLFLTKKLPEAVTELKSTTTSGEIVNITIKYTSVVPMTQGSCLQILNLALKRAMEALKLQMVGKHFFDAAARIEVLDHKLQLWPGFYTSIRQYEHDILVSVEVAHKIMRNETVYDVLQNCIKANSADYKNTFRRYVIGITILTDFNNRTYKIHDVDFDSSPETTFDHKYGTESYCDYYFRRHRIEIRDRKQPLLISLVKSKNREKRECIGLVPELCRLTGVTEEMRTNFRLMRAVSDYTRLDPKERMRKLHNFNVRLNRCEESVNIFKEWGMELERKIVDIKARVLNPETVIFGNDVRIETNLEADWTRHVKTSEMFGHKPLTHWCLIYPSYSESLVREFIGALITTAKGMSFTIADPKIKKNLDDDRQGAYANAIDQCCQESPSLIMCVVPNNRADRYAAIKKKSCIDRAIPTQVILTKTITPKMSNAGSLFSVSTKIAVQLSCKLGGVPWMINLPLSGLMTIGFDVCHIKPTKTSPRISYGALVSTMDLKRTNKYYSATTVHTSGKELSSELAVTVLKAVRAYQLCHDGLPNRIIFYRDGVNEGQVDFIYNTEVKLIEIRLHEFYKANNAKEPPKFSFIVVNKRTNTRIFAKNMNPPPGTIIDNVITRPERYDFFLISQSVRQGTVSPTSYNVIKDTSRLSPDRMQILTYKMCHMYYNWCGTTRVPSVCQYAHKLAFLVGHYLQQPPSNLLEKQLYFL